LDLHIGKPQVPIELVSGPDNSGVSHTVLKVGSLSAKETWIFHIAGCQYGFRDVLVPYRRYFAERSYRLLEQATTYDATETKDLDYFLTLPFIKRTRAEQENPKAE
jgi:hypothetical protein